MAVQHGGLQGRGALQISKTYSKVTKTQRFLVSGDLTLMKTELGILYPISVSDPACWYLVPGKPVFQSFVNEYVYS